MIVEWFFSFSLTMNRGISFSPFGANMCSPTSLIWPPEVHTPLCVFYLALLLVELSIFISAVRVRLCIENKKRSLTKNRKCCFIDQLIQFQISCALKGPTLTRSASEFSLQMLFWSCFSFSLNLGSKEQINKYSLFSSAFILPLFWPSPNDLSRNQDFPPGQKRERPKQASTAPTLNGVLLLML